MVSRLKRKKEDYVLEQREKEEIPWKRRKIVRMKLWTKEEQCKEEIMWHRKRSFKRRLCGRGRAV